MNIIEFIFKCILVITICFFLLLPTYINLFKESIWDYIKKKIEDENNKKKKNKDD